MRKDKKVHALPHPLGYVKTNNRKMNKSRHKSVERIQSVPIYEEDKYRRKILKGYRYISHESISTNQL